MMMMMMMTTTTGHLLSHQHQVVPSSEPKSGTVPTAWQQQQLIDYGAAMLQNTHPVAAASRKLLQATKGALISPPGISPNSGNSSNTDADGSSNSTSNDSKRTSSP
jgi:hypothetical protein